MLALLQFIEAPRAVAAPVSGLSTFQNAVH